MRRLRIAVAVDQQHRHLDLRRRERIELVLRRASRPAPDRCCSAVLTNVDERRAGVGVRRDEIRRGSVGGVAQPRGLASAGSDGAARMSGSNPNPSSTTPAIVSGCLLRHHRGDHRAARESRTDRRQPRPPGSLLHPRQRRPARRRRRDPASATRSRRAASRRSRAGRRAKTSRPAPASVSMKDRRSPGDLQIEIRKAAPGAAVDAAGSSPRAAAPRASAPRPRGGGRRRRRRA